MALIRCTDCGGEISDSAPTCPRCGAPTKAGQKAAKKAGKKKTSVFTWLVLIFVVLLVLGALQETTSTSSAPSSAASSSSDSSEKLALAKKAAPVKPSWRTTSSKDEMTGKVSAHAQSPTVYPTSKMSFPYEDVRGWMGVGCDGKNEWVYVGFSSAPNLNDTDTEDGYNAIETRIKWDDQVESVKMTQTWGDKFLNFVNDSSAMSKIAASNSVLLELKWHGQQATHFEFTLRGSSKALAEIRAKCAS